MLDQVLSPPASYQDCFYALTRSEACSFRLGFGARTFLDASPPRHPPEPILCLVLRSSGRQDLSGEDADEFPGGQATMVEALERTTHTTTSEHSHQGSFSPMTRQDKASKVIDKPFSAKRSHIPSPTSPRPQPSPHHQPPSSSPTPPSLLPPPSSVSLLALPLFSRPAKPRLPLAIPPQLC